MYKALPKLTHPLEIRFCDWLVKYQTLLEADNESGKKLCMYVCMYYGKGFLRIFNK